MKKILVIDDEKSVCTQIREILLHFGYSAAYVTRPEWALPRLEHETFDLILMDINMPVVNGITLLRQIKADPNLGQIPIIMLSGEVDDEYLVQCFELGATDYIHKPVNERIFKARLETALAAKSGKDDLEKAVKNRTAELEKLSKVFQLFVPKPFLNRILQQQTPHAGQFEEEKLTIMFVDIRSYTSLSEQMTSEDVFQFLNTYYGLVGPCISKNNGYVDKYLGDGLVALFDGYHSAENAIKSAIEMQQKINDYNQTRGTPDRPLIRIGIGINTGKVMLGTLGSFDRISPTVIGDHVNLAARIESTTKRYNASILISQTTYVEIDTDRYCVREIDTIQVRGRKNPVVLYEVFDADTEYLKNKKLESRGLLLKCIILYKLQSFEEALEILLQCLSIFPQDVVILEYINRCRYFRKYPPHDPSWFGVVNDTTKFIDHSIRRHSRRYPLKTSAKFYSLNSETHLAGIVANIGKGGIQLELGKKFEIGELLLVEVFFLKTSLEQYLSQDSPKILCRVVWNKLTNPSMSKPYWTLGMTFIMMTLEQEKALYQGLESLPKAETEFSQ